VPDTHSQASILLVDDLPANLMALEALLAPSGHRLVQAASGQEALRCALQEDFAVILMDVRLGDMSGIEVTAMLRDRERTRHTPVLLMTASHSDDRELLDGYAHGAVDYLRKPLVTEVLRAKVAVFVDLYRAREAVRRHEEALRTRERQALTAELKEQEQQFRALANSIPQLAWITRADGWIYWYNQRWYDYTGTTPEQVEGWGWKALQDPADLDRVVARFVAAIREGRPWEDRFRLRGKDGTFRWFLSRAMPMRDSEGRIVKWFGTNTDIDEEQCTLEQLRQAQQEVRNLNADLERRVAERTVQLQEANSELESFSYSVSHDLRAPLRHITGFAQLLVRRAGPALDEACRGYADTIVTAAQQGSTLIDDLLSFSRMSRAPVNKRPVDLRALMDEVRRELEADATGREVQWRIGELPTVEADPGLLRQVVRNLLGNALKYTRPQPQALIEVGARLTPEAVEVWVRDNGVGFDMQYADKLFGVFQRLHTPDEFEGTGIGLANVRRIIARHGGRSWAEGAPGQGATFHFSLPRLGAGT
jgi:PAS domain S-box-containing protein